MKDAPYLLSITKTFISDYELLFSVSVHPFCVKNKKPTIHRKQNESSDSSAAKAASGASPAGTEQEGISESNPFDNLPASNEETFLLLEISAFLDGYTSPAAPENPSVPSAAQADSVLLAELDSFIAQ